MNVGMTPTLSFQTVDNFFGQHICVPLIFWNYFWTANRNGVSIMLIFSVMLNRKCVLLNITSSVPQLPRFKLYIPKMKLYGCFTLERSSCTISQKQEAIMRCKGHSWVRNRGRKRINLDCGLKSWRPYNAVWSLGWPPCLADRKEWKPTLRRIIFSLTTDPDK